MQKNETIKRKMVTIYNDKQNNIDKSYLDHKAAVSITQCRQIVQQLSDNEEFMLLDYCNTAVWSYGISEVGLTEAQLLAVPNSVM